MLIEVIEYILYSLNTYWCKWIHFDTIEYIKQKKCREEFRWMWKLLFQKSLFSYPFWWAIVGKSGFLSLFVIVAHRTHFSCCLNYDHPFCTRCNALFLWILLLPQKLKAIFLMHYKVAPQHNYKCPVFPLDYCECKKAAKSC